MRAMEQAVGREAAGAATPRWGMVVDLNRCVGCQTCTIACKHANDTLPGIQWRRVLDVERGEFPDVERLFLVVGCQHCDEPPCVPVCPTGATSRRADGLVTMNYDVCIGCGYCAVSCPYQARTIAHESHPYYPDQSTPQEDLVAHPDRLGVAQKCTFCVDRVDAGLAQGLTPGVDAAATPACSAACIAQAIHFGDFASPDSNVSRLVRDKAGFVMHEELGTRPSIRYLYETPAIPGRDPTPAETDDTVMSDPANPLVGARQHFWDFRAAMNFTMGGMGSGLAVMTWLANATAGLPEPLMLGLFIIAGVSMAVGLTFVFFEIGRKLRFLNALRRPQSSWMTREMYVVGLFYPVLAADLLWPQPLLHALVALIALGFLYCQARILHAAKGISAWRVPLMPWMLLATGLYEGLGLLVAAVFLVAPQILWGPLATFAGGLGLVLATINAGLWHAYRRSAKAQGIVPLARREISAVTPWLHIMGHTLPALLFTTSLVIGGAPIAIAAAGIAVVIGGVRWKFRVITRACYRQGFALPKLPQRGSGIRAAPALAALGGDAD